MIAAPSGPRTTSTDGRTWDVARSPTVRSLAGDACSSDHLSSARQPCRNWITAWMSSTPAASASRRAIVAPSASAISELGDEAMARGAGAAK